MTRIRPIFLCCLWCGLIEPASAQVLEDVLKENERLKAEVRELKARLSRQTGGKDGEPKADE